MPLNLQQVLQCVTEHGFTLLPLHKGTKRPMVTWGAFRSKAQPLATRLQLLRPGFESDTDWGILNGPASGTYCIDFDIGCRDADLRPFYRFSYTPTPSGGRHYFFAYEKPWGFKTGVRPSIDIPWVTKLYATPTINPGKPPIVTDSVVSAHSGLLRPTANDSVTEESLCRCEFIRAFRIRRSDPTWENRYPAARAYISCAILSDSPDTSAGPGYRWQAHIENDPGRPATCKTIARVFGCGRYDGCAEVCTLGPGIRSPIGLAKYYDRIANHRGETTNGNRISLINL